MDIIRNVYMIVFCHVVGDYVLQSDFLAKTKGDNYYHLVVHCLLYVVPFVVLYGFDWRALVLFFSHILIDMAKARLRKINYFQDQLLHYGFAILLYL